MCQMQRHNGDGGAVDKSRGYVVKLEVISMELNLYFGSNRGSNRD